MSSLQLLRETGEAMGLTGTDLAAFIKEQQAFERDERQHLRDLEKERLDLEREKLLKSFEKDLDSVKLEQQAKDKDREHEREQREREREQHERDREERERERERDRELKKLEYEQQEKDRQFELERLTLEIERGRTNNSAGKEEIAGNQESHQSDGEAQDDAASETNSNHGRHRYQGFRGPKMPPFDESHDNMDAFLHRFEIYASAQDWKKERWAVFLSALLKGKALDVYSRLPVSEAQDYEQLKSALLKRFNLTKDGFKQRFRTATPETNEAPAQFIVRLQSYFGRWIQLSGVEETFQDLSDLIVKEQYIDTCPADLAVFLREHDVTNLTAIGKLAEQYTEAHAGKVRVNTNVERKIQSNFRGRFQPFPPQQRPSMSRIPRLQNKICFECGKNGHIAKNCFNRRPTASMQFSGNEQQIGSRGRGGYIQSGQSYGRSCYRPYQNTVQTRNFAQNQSSTKNQNETEVKQSTSTTVNGPKCRQHHREQCHACFEEFPSHQCNAMMGKELELKCGCTIPIIADACNSHHRTSNMPVVEGIIGEQHVSVLRDTGCSAVVVRRSLVSDDQLTGAQQTCVLIDGTIRRTPIAEVELNTPYFKGTVKAVCMKNPIYDVIIGNIPGAEDPICGQEQQETQAVVTRQMEKKLQKPEKPLKVIGSIDASVTREDVIRMQKEDESLKRFWVNVGQIDENEKAKFIVRDDILYRQFPTHNGHNITQLVVPTTLRNKILKLAHESILGGHQGINKTKDKIWMSFWWSGLTGDVTRFCRSCDICQRTVVKGRVPPVPLGKMPIIDTPFDRVAVDLVGPIYPASATGSRYILTLVDYATRYPEATALKDITAETVAEAMVNMFSRVGVPREILSDQGSQFMSGVMKEVSRLLSVRQLVTSPYHPACNGLVEKFNGTLKSMLKRMCAEKPRDWDRYIGPLLFAYRETPQASLGYSPFELLYGRQVRGPMTILRELWTREHSDSEVRSTYQYVVDLKERLQDTCELAHEELKKSQLRQHKYYNQKTKVRKFKAGDRVLVLRPTDNNKLLMQWQGPFDIIEHVRENDYKIQICGRQRTYHANMLKQYFERTEEISTTGFCEVVNAAILEPEEGDEGDLEIFSNKQTETYKDVDINPELSDSQKQEIKDILYEFRDVFSDVPGITNLGKHSIQLTTAEPIHGKPYPLPHSMREVVDAEIDAMLKAGVIEPSTSAYASPIVIVRKPDGSNRVCVDYRKLNKITVFDAEPMPQIEELFAKLSNDQYYSKFDLSKGYWQVEMEEEDKPITAFITHRGLNQFRVMPFGLINAPATFNRIMRKLLDKTDNLDSYLDDVLAHTKDWQQQLQAIRLFFERVRNANLKLKPSKCSVGYGRVKFLGHLVGNREIKPNQETVDKLLQAPRPVTKKQLRSFLGLVGYFRRFIPNFAAVAVPLTDLTRKGTSNELDWGQPQIQAYNTLRDSLVHPPILRLPDVNRPFILQTDASADGIGAILLQEELGVKHPIAYVSKKLLPREKNYSTIERECLAILWGIQKFQTYLYGTHFVLETDHQPLLYLNRAQFQNGRLMRWALALQPYRFTIKSIKGSENVGADYLSRHSVE